MHFLTSIVEILQSLYFPEIDARHERIAEAHQRTYEWIYSSCDVGFADWLENGNGVFWVSGKAGSGKSTLMKLLYDDPRTREHLKSNASQQHWTIAAYFFYSSGTSLQKSQNGMLRSILHQVLRENPTAIRKVCSHKFPQLANHQAYAGSYMSDPKWSSTDLERAFCVLLSEMPLDKGLLLLIDGLDEYEGNDHDLVRVVQSIIADNQVSNLKVCVSSRPETVFEDGFAAYPKLRLQDLTKKDIEIYVRDRLNEKTKMQSLLKSDPAGTWTLIYQVTYKSSGVFLWVYLVVKSLMDGICNYDTIRQLQERVDECPPELEDLFGSMLSNVESMYHSQTSRVFRVISAQQEMHWEVQALQLWHIDEDDFNQDDEADQLGSFKDIWERLHNIDLRLQSCCAGLVEIEYDYARAPRTVLEKLASRNHPNAEQEAEWIKACIDIIKIKVRFMHKSVQDFLDSSPTSLAKITARGYDRHFNPHLWLHKASLNRVKLFSYFFSRVFPQSSLLITELLICCWNVIEDFLHCSRYIEEVTSEAQTGSLEDLDKAVQRYITPQRLREIMGVSSSKPDLFTKTGFLGSKFANSIKPHHWSNWFGVLNKTRRGCRLTTDEVFYCIVSRRDTFLSSAVKNGLSVYVQKVSQMPGFQINENWLAFASLIRRDLAT